MMLLQRLKVLRDTSFTFDYMGNADYEFGAASNGRELLTRLAMVGDFAGKAAKFIEIVGQRSCSPIDVFVFGSKEFIAMVPDEMRTVVTHESFRTDNNRVQAWMRVGRPKSRPFDPMLIVRATDENIRRGNEFVGDWMKQIKAVEAEDAAYAQDIHDATVVMIEKQEKLFDRQEQEYQRKINP